MKINWKVRFRNKAWLASVAALVITFVYGMLEAFEVVPSVSEYRVGQIIQGVLTVLGLLGVVIDPTTAGVEDSNRAMGYEHPWNDDVDWDGTSETNRTND